MDETFQRSKQDVIYAARMLGISVENAEKLANQLASGRKSTSSGGATSEQLPQFGDPGGGAGREPDLSPSKNLHSSRSKGSASDKDRSSSRKDKSRSKSPSSDAYNRGSSRIDTQSQSPQSSRNKNSASDSDRSSSSRGTHRHKSPHTARSRSPSSSDSHRKSSRQGSSRRSEATLLDHPSPTKGDAHRSRSPPTSRSSYRSRSKSPSVQESTLAIPHSRTSVSKERSSSHGYRSGSKAKESKSDADKLADQEAQRQLQLTLKRIKELEEQQSQQVG